MMMKNDEKRKEKNNFRNNKNFTDYAEEMPDDLYYIELAEKEFANGETHSWADINWKKK